jgi:hypothetical protein
MSILLASFSVHTVRLTLFLLALCVPTLLLRAEKGTPSLSASHHPSQSFHRRAALPLTVPHPTPVHSLTRTHRFFAGPPHRAIPVDEFPCRPSLRSRSIVAQSRAYDVPVICWTFDKCCRCLFHASSCCCRQLCYRHGPTLNMVLIRSNIFGSSFLWLKLVRLLIIVLFEPLERPTACLTNTNLTRPAPPHPTRQHHTENRHYNSAKPSSLLIVSGLVDLAYTSMQHSCHVVA